MASNGLRLCLGLVLALGASVSVAAESATTPSEPFAVAGITYAEAGEFLQRLHDAVSENDAGAVAALTHFPLTVNGKPGPKNAAELAQQFSEIYTEPVRSAVLGQTVEALFTTWKGLVIGHGEVWFSVVCDPDSPRGSCNNRGILVVQVNNLMARPNNRGKRP